MQLQVSVKNIRISPRKLRLVADVARGKSALQAQRELQFLVKKGAEPMLKLLNSAIANAKHNNKVDVKDLVVKAVMVNEGFTIKRFRARAFGRASMIRKRTSHIIMTLESVTATEKPKAEKASKAKTSVTAETPKKVATTAEKKPATPTKSTKK